MNGELRYIDKGPFYLEWGDGVILWIGRLRFAFRIRAWWWRGE